MRKGRVLGVLLIAVLATVGTASAQNTTNRNFTVPLSGDEEVPPRATQARGVAIFQLSPEGTTLSYRLIGANIENVVQAHIHCGAAGVNGPVVAFLSGPAPAGGGRTNGPLAEGTITAASVIPRPPSPECPLGVANFEQLLDRMRSGLAYVNVHTDDGVPPPNTGPGDFPGGEIRGQIH
jgi:hypothetical protein